MSSVFFAVAIVINITGANSFGAQIHKSIDNFAALRMRQFSNLVLLRSDPELGVRHFSFLQQRTAKGIRPAGSLPVGNMVLRGFSPLPAFSSHRFEQLTAKILDS